MKEHAIHYHRSIILLQMLWFLLLACCCIATVSSASYSPQQVVTTSWVTVAPSSSRSSSSSHRNALLPTLNIGKQLRVPVRSSSPFSSLNHAAQDKILDGLRMKWGDNDDNSKSSSQTQKNSVNGGGDNNNQTPTTVDAVPFIIQKIGRGTKSEIEEITRLCIDVFFNEQENVQINADGTKKIPPWKALQLAYLRNFQTGDILARNAFKRDTLSDLIVARRVYHASDDDAPTKKIMDGGTDEVGLIDDTSQIYNREQLSSSSKNGSGDTAAAYVTGEIIGYCEVSEKNFGLALQVEEDNHDAIRFYNQRGWEFVFADPTCRILKESRITKYAMIKRLDTKIAAAGGSNADRMESNGMREIR
ncbi:hypothetical protein ACHAXR_001208 [Thalassiosira sp. AJA248-18]